MKGQLLIAAGAIAAVSLAGGGVALGADPAYGHAGRANWSAGPVAVWTGYHKKGGSDRVREVQRLLRRHGHPPGPIDGLFGPLTQAAVLSFQTAHGLVADGIVGPRTLDALRRPTGGEQRSPRTPATRKPAPHPPAVPAPPAPAPRAVPPAPAPRAVPPAPDESPPGGGGPGLSWPGILVLLGFSTLLAGATVAARAIPKRKRAAPQPAALVPAEPAAPDAAVEHVLRDEAVARAAPGAPVPAAGRDGGEPAPACDRPPGRRLGALLREAGALSEAELVRALEEQRRSGGRLGEVLVAHGVVPAATLTAAVARQLGVETVQRDDEPVMLLSADEARAWRAVPLDGNGRSDGAVPVALTDANATVLAALEARLERPVVPRLADDAALDELLNRVYATVDAEEVTRMLREEAPDLSAFRTTLSRPQVVVACVLGFAVTVGLLADLRTTATVLVTIATAFFVISTSFRLYAAWQGSAAGATVDPPADELAAMDERELPPYTVLLPLYKEKPSTVSALFESLSRVDYPKQKLDGLLLIEDDDSQTRAAIEKVGRPPWMRVLPLPPGVPRTKPRAMGIGLRYARGTFLTVYDAEDKPDPAQLKKAVWAFARADESLACLQGKLGYYNPRQNLLTRWFTLEYDAWFNIFLPGLHRIGAPIPLGGTSNHFRRPALDACLGWDPYNVTEDADLGLRFARLGLTTAMLESTTGEEANSRVPNWLRQRSRWSKGYMQTLLVHTRRPGKLVRELGLRATAAFLVTIGGAVVTALLAPVFWVLLVLWFVFQPDWIAALFPGPVYYAASLSLVFGNFALVFLSLVAAVRRGHDDLSPHALLIPIYWLLMSAATYMALVELLVRPYHWHKTEHGLHLAEEAT